MTRCGGSPTTTGRGRSSQREPAPPAPPAGAPGRAVVDYVQRAERLLWTPAGAAAAGLAGRARPRRGGAAPQPGRRRPGPTLPAPPEGVAGRLAGGGLSGVVAGRHVTYVQARYLDPPAGRDKYDNPARSHATNPRVAWLHPSTRPARRGAGGHRRGRRRAGRRPGRVPDGRGARLAVPGPSSRRRDHADDGTVPAAGRGDGGGVFRRRHVRPGRRRSARAVCSPSAVCPIVRCHRPTGSTSPAGRPADPSGWAAVLRRRAPHRPLRRRLPTAPAPPASPTPGLGIGLPGPG